MGSTSSHGSSSRTTTVASNCRGAQSAAGTPPTMGVVPSCTPSSITIVSALVCCAGFPPQSVPPPTRCHTRRACGGCAALRGRAPRGALLGMNRCVHPIGCAARLAATTCAGVWCRAFVAPRGSAETILCGLFCLWCQHGAACMAQGVSVTCWGRAATPQSMRLATGCTGCCWVEVGKVVSSEWCAAASPQGALPAARCAACSAVPPRAATS